MYQKAPHLGGWHYYQASGMEFRAVSVGSSSGFNKYSILPHVACVWFKGFPPPAKKKKL